MGLPYTVTALVVIILGGLGNVLGSLVGALLLGVVETASVYLSPSDIRPIVSYAMLALILILDRFVGLNRAIGQGVFRS
mgnify:CR=1 FL=1